jgi:hypothetical protein
VGEYELPRLESETAPEVVYSPESIEQYMSLAASIIADEHAREILDINDILVGRQEAILSTLSIDIAEAITESLSSAIELLKELMKERDVLLSHSDYKIYVSEVSYDVISASRKGKVANGDLVIHLTATIENLTSDKNLPLPSSFLTSKENIYGTKPTVTIWG